MTLPLLTLVLMVKNEARSIRNVIESIRPAVDCVDLLDTGSTDETQRIARETCERLRVPLHLHEEPFIDYATSRNRALMLAARHAVFGIQVSGDEISVNPEALRAFCEKRRDATGIGSNLYMVCVDVGAGTLYSTRLVRLASAWRWKNRIHEYMANLDNPEDRPTELLKGSLFSIQHRDTDPVRKKIRLYNDLRILQEDHAADPNDARSVLYIAQTLAGLELFEDAIRYYVKRSTMGDWEEERYIAMYRAGLCAWKLNKPWPEIQDYMLTATVIRPSRAEALTRLAEFCWERKDFARAFFYAHRATMIPFPETDCFGVEPDVYEIRALNMVHLTGLLLGELDIGERATRLLIERAPEEPAFPHNLQRYLDMKAARTTDGPARAERTPIVPVAGLP